MLAWSLLLPAPFSDEPGIGSFSDGLAQAPGPPVYRPGAIMRDFAVGPDGKWDLSRNNAIWAADEIAIAQQIGLRLQIQKGERFDDQELGVDYADSILGIGHTKGQLTAPFRDAILTVPGVASLRRLAVTRQNDGTLLVDWIATANNGALVSGQTIANGG